ncbi:MAG: glycosyltransferase family 4 protein [Ignavibacteria bacterium]|nr:glycosyltransferase family 4 protein [Ignavibacteria bacterium]
MKTVLFIVNEFPPSGGGGIIRPLKFVKYLQEFQWKPIIISRDYSENLYLKDNKLLNEIPAIVKVYRVSSLEPDSLKKSLKTKLSNAYNNQYTVTLSKKIIITKLFSILKASKDFFYEKILIPDEHILWVVNAVKKAKKILKSEKIDVIFTTSPPPSTHLVGFLLKRSFPQTKWIVDFRDLWTIEDTYHQQKPFLIRKINEYLEHKILEKCDKSIFATSGFQDAYMKKYINIVPDKSSCITNGYDPDDFKNTPTGVSSEKFQITYTGSLLKKQSENSFFDGLKLFVDDQINLRKDKFQANFVGKFEEYYLQKIDKLLLRDYVNVIDYVTHTDAVKFMTQANVLILFLSNDRMCKMIWPGKIFEYLAAQKPILALVPEGMVSRFIRTHNLGIVVNPDDSEGIKEGISIFYERYKKNKLSIRVPEELLQNFDRRELTRKLANEFNSQIKN